MPRTIEFDPESNLSQLSDFIEFGVLLRINAEPRRVEIGLPRHSILRSDEIGKLLMMNGRLRGSRLRPVFYCSRPILNQLSDLNLHRILWLEAMNAAS